MIMGLLNPWNLPDALGDKWGQINISEPAMAYAVDPEMLI
jgi:hypothetical protein